MTKKNIFAHKIFLSLNISDFNLFLYENCNPPTSPPCLKKVTPLFSSNLRLKVEVLSSPSPFFWKFGWWLNPPCYDSLWLQRHSLHIICLQRQQLFLELQNFIGNFMRLIFIPKSSPCYWMSYLRNHTPYDFD